MAKLQPLIIPPYTNYTKALMLVIEKLNIVTSLMNDISLKVFYMEKNLTKTNVNAVSNTPITLNPNIKIIKKEVTSNA